MAQDTENPLIRALPPATDYLSYLTIVEYNLTEDQLPVLHRLLQDLSLTENIGWDLVHLLIPLLPASKQCLDDVARLGNPREVILRVTERMDLIGQATESVETMSSSEGDDDRELEHEEAHEGFSATQTRTAGTSGEEFQVLAGMISTLFPRIQTQRPSRFLVTSLKATLLAYAHVAPSRSATTAVLDLVELLSQARRPPLPPRARDVTDVRVPRQDSAADPEGKPGSLASDEDELQVQLLRSFITHIMEVYVESLLPIGEAPGMAWTERLEEKIHAEQAVPFRKSMLARFAESQDLDSRDYMAQQLLRRGLLSLGMQVYEMIWIATHSATELSQRDNSESTNPSLLELPLSRRGTLYLLAAKTASQYLYGSTTDEHVVSLDMHMDIVKSFIGDPFMSGIGSEPLSLIDSVLLIGRACFHDDHNVIGSSTWEDFNQYLQRLSLLSANTPSSSLRFQAHLLTSAVLHAHPSDQVRYNFIRDTLEHCPVDSLKVSAIGWLKDEMVATNLNENKQSYQRGETAPATSKTDESSSARKHPLFASPAGLTSLVPYLFPRLSPEEDTARLCGQMPFFLAALNFYYLICISTVLRDRLELDEWSEMHDIDVHFIDPLRAISRRLGAEIDGEEVLSTDAGRARADLVLLEDSLDQATLAAASAKGKR